MLCNFDMVPWYSLIIAFIRHCCLLGTPVNPKYHGIIMLHGQKT